MKRIVMNNEESCPGPSTARWPISPSTPPSKVPALVVLNGDDPGRVCELTEAEMVLGRGQACQIQLPDAELSRRHVRISRVCAGVEQGDGRRRGTGEQVMLTDLGSTNGTLVNGERVQEHVLADGDRVQLGPHVILRFAWLDHVELKLYLGLRDAAMRDSLTQLFNRRFFDEELTRAHSLSCRHSIPLSVLVIDMDHFKQINDNYGHDAGDRVLQQTARLLTRAVRQEDVVCRIGGEEFAVIARSTPGPQASTLAERLRHTIAQAPVPHGDQQLHVTVSIGVAALDPACQLGSETLFKAADRALFAAKRGGRDQVCMAERQQG